jgi:hypothetical protein
MIRTQRLWQVECVAALAARPSTFQSSCQGMLQQTNSARHMAKSVYSGISTTLMIVGDDGSVQPRGFLLFGIRPNVEGEDGKASGKIKCTKFLPSEMKYWRPSYDSDLSGLSFPVECEGFEATTPPPKFVYYVEISLDPASQYHCL